MIRPILNDPNFPGTVLRQVAEPVTDFNEDVRHLVQDLTDTLYDSGGIGLAANQIGALQRVCVIDLTQGKPNRKNLLVFVNPKLRKARGEQKMNEGCLSLPNRQARPTRHARIEVEAQDVEGRSFRIRADGLLAVCIQHEMDHLDGILMTARETLGLTA